MILVFLMFLSISLNSFCSVPKIVDRKDAVAQEIFIDKFGNQYFINNNTIIKIDNSNSSLINYTNNLYGEITSIDVSNPFRLLVFYQDFNCIIFLDNQLTELRSPISLDDLGFYNIDAACNSIDGGFWIFDYVKQQVIQLSSNLNITQKGTELSFLNKKSKVQGIRETNDYILIFYDIGDLIVLDRYGSYHKRVDNLLGKKYRVKGKNIFSVDGNTLTVTDIVTLQQKEYQLITNKMLSFDIFGDKLYWLTDKELITFLIE